MYCSKCGRQIEEDAHFCLYCGAENRRQKTDQPPDFPAATALKADETIESTAGQKYFGEERVKKWTKKKIITVASVFAVVVVIIVCLITLNDDRSKLISLVQNGYLGNYDTVTVKEVLEYSFGGGEWNAGEALNGKSYIVEYKTDDVVFQFSVPEIDADTFQVSGIGFDKESSGWSAYETKVYLDALYGYYAEEHRGCGVVMDRNTSNNTLQGRAR